MPEAPPLTLNLAKRIERITARNALGDAEIVEFGEAIVGKAKGGRPRNWVFCFGHPDIPGSRRFWRFIQQTVWNRGSH